jgi:hypothetical protein
VSWLPIAETNKLDQKRPKSREARTFQGMTRFFMEIFE